MVYYVGRYQLMEIILLDRNAACELLKIRPEALSEMVKQGEIPVTLIGRRKLFRRVDLEAYLARLHSPRQRWVGHDYEGEGAFFGPNEKGEFVWHG
jgi:excisionase family DNA binding protein